MKLHVSQEWIKRVTESDAEEPGVFTGPVEPFPPTPPLTFAGAIDAGRHDLISRWLQAKERKGDSYEAFCLEQDTFLVMVRTLLA